MYLNDICTIPSNLAGHAAMSVPSVRRCRRARPGTPALPIGVQVLAPALGEQLMFRVARAIELAAAQRCAAMTTTAHATSGRR